MFLFLPFIINVKMLSIYILIKSWAPWSNIHTSECKGPKIKPDSWHLFSYSGILIQARAINIRKRKEGDNTCWPGPGWQLSVHIKIGPNMSWDNGQCREWQILVSVCQDWHQCHCQCQAVTTLTTLDSHVFHVTRATYNILSSVKLKYVMRISSFEMDRDRKVKM